MNWLQIDRKLTIDEFYILTRSKSLNKMMREQHVRLIKFNHDSEKMTELQRHQTVGYLVGENKISLEIVKRFISNFYPKKIILYRIQKIHPYQKIGKVAIEEYMKILYLPKILDEFKKFDPQLESEIKTREAKEFFEFYLIVGSNKNIVTEMESLVNFRAREIFILNFSVCATNETFNMDGDFWNNLEEFNQRLLQKHFVLKYKKEKNGGLLFSLVGKHIGYLKEIYPNYFQKLPLFENKTSDATLMLRMPSQSNLKDLLGPRIGSIQIKIDDNKKPYAKCEFSGPTPSVVEAVNSICNTYYVFLKNNNGTDKAKKVQINQS